MSSSSALLSPSKAGDGKDESTLPCHPEQPAGQSQVLPGIQGFSDCHLRVRFQLRFVSRLSPRFTGQRICRGGSTARRSPCLPGFRGFFGSLSPCSWNEDTGAGLACDLIDEAPAKGGRGIDPASGKSQPGRTLPANSGRQARGPARPGHEAHPDLGELKERVLARAYPSTERWELTPRAHAGAVQVRPRS